MPAPSLGRIVRYFDRDTDYAAMIVHVTPAPPPPPAPPSGAQPAPPPPFIPTVDLHVFGHFMHKGGIHYVTEVVEDPTCSVARTWHWPEKAKE